MWRMHRIAVGAERLVYRVAGLPTALRYARREPISPAQTIRAAFARRYWHPANASEWLELAAGLLIWPVALILSVLWFTVRNGSSIARREGKTPIAQAAEQLALYFEAGVCGPWYYIFSLHRDGSRRAPTFLQRYETKWRAYYDLQPRPASNLTDKDQFAARCAAHGIRCVPTLLRLDGCSSSVELPDADLFVKVARGRGGKGAERWDRIGPSSYGGGEGQILSADALRQHLIDKARAAALIVQPRLVAHADLAILTSGALPTVRALTCLDELGAPEFIGGVFRMSIGANRTVDNFHAGGIACRVDLASGALGKASNLGADARLGWLSLHPDTGAEIEGAGMPFWEETKALAVEAHGVFGDRVIIGWDIGILSDGPMIVEGNGSPDLDIMQRFQATGYAEHRFAELLAHHLRARGLVG